jgi:hypothetical protein
MTQRSRLAVSRSAAQTSACVVRSAEGEELGPMATDAHGGWSSRTDMDTRVGPMASFGGLDHRKCAPAPTLALAPNQGTL